MEIYSRPGYEKSKLGIDGRIDEYNKIIMDIFPENIVRIRQQINEVKGFNQDNLHWNKRGHKIVAKILLDNIRKDID